MISVDEPVSRRRPTDDELDLLVSVSEHVALAIEEAQASAVRDRYQEALRQLLQVSSRLTETLSVDSILQEVCGAISRALGFDKVSIELLASHGAFVPRASAGWGADGPPKSGLTPETLGPLFDSDYEIEGCFLLPLEFAEKRIQPRNQVYTSSLNGAGPRAWNRHWLLVPLYDRDGTLDGFIWADDPVDRLLPAQEKLQALRLFANQATTALDSAKRFAEMEFLADHDPLTRLGNRRAFVANLESEAARAARYGSVFTLVLCDLDEFKSVNDRAGHLAGDDFLVEFAARLGASIRKADSAFRIGGDEFALILVHASGQEARRVVERIAEATNKSGSVRASFGVAVFEPSESPEEIFRRADEAMYRAKRSGDAVAFAAAA
jgi:diguanylate cyclase (GGDEF)-like protein